MIEFIDGYIRNVNDSSCADYIDLNTIVRVIGAFNHISIFTCLDKAPIVIYWYPHIRDFIDDWKKLEYAIGSLGNKTMKYCGGGKYQIENTPKVIKTGDGYIGGFFYKEEIAFDAFDDSFIKVNDILEVTATKFSSNIINMIRINMKYGYLYWVYDTEENMKNKIKEIQEVLEEQEKNDKRRKWFLLLDK